MVKQLHDDPFADSDAAPLRVPAGAFRADAAAPIERTGSTNARIVLGQPLARLRAVSQRVQLGRILAICTTIAMVLVVPLMISGFASVRRAAIAAETTATATATLLVISPEAQEVLSQVQPIDGAFVASSTISEESKRNRMQELLGTAKARAYDNDAQGARAQLDETVAYFVSEYSQALPARVDEILEEYPYSEAETDERIEELKATITSNAQGQDLTALVAAVVELPQRVGDAMSEHIGNRITYVPPTPTPTPQPTQPPTPQPTAPQPSAPSLTQGPPPDPSGGPQPPAPPPPSHHVPPQDDDDDD